MPSQSRLAKQGPPLSLASPAHPGESGAATYQGHCRNVATLMAAAIAGPARSRMEDIRDLIDAYLEVTGADVAAEAA